MPRQIISDTNDETKQNVGMHNSIYLRYSNTTLQCKEKLQCFTRLLIRL